MEEEQKVCHYVAIYELTEQIPCRTREEAEKRAEELKESWNAPAVIQVEEGTEADYEAHFGVED